MTCKVLRLIAKEQLNTQATSFGPHLECPGPAMYAEDRMEHSVERLSRDVSKEANSISYAV